MSFTALGSLPPVENTPPISWGQYFASHLWAAKDYMEAYIDDYARTRVIFSFHIGYRVLASSIAESRRDVLFKKYNAEELKCVNDYEQQIDALVIKSQSDLRTGNIWVICLNTTYLDHHPKHWAPFLENGADVALWNPTKATPKAYSQDLRHVLSALREKNPDQIIAVTSYCMATDAAILAVSEMKDPNIHLIVDRGHGNAPALVRSKTFWGRLPLVRRIIDEECDCHGIEKIRQLRGRMLFIFPEKIDQIMDYGAGKSFTKDLYNLRMDSPRVTIEDGDHWSRWDYKTYSQILSFLSEIGVVAPKDSFQVDPELYPLAPPLDCYREMVVQPKLKCKAAILSQF